MASGRRTEKTRRSGADITAKNNKRKEKMEKELHETSRSNAEGKGEEMEKQQPTDATSSCRHVCVSACMCAARGGLVGVVLHPFVAVVASPPKLSSMLLFFGCYHSFTPS